MKKILLLIIACLFLSGCTANYEITIFDKTTDTGWTVRDSFNSLLDSDEFGQENYNVKSLTNDERLGVEYTSKAASSIINSSILNQCYNNPKIENNDGIITINTGSNFECYEFYDNLESVRVVFKTNHKVISTNAEEVDGDKYIWNITKNGNKQIEIVLDPDGNGNNL